ncbi:recQ-mediated genome instability protein 1 [Halichoeres trimaculatus]|uniref:recQ-mediated genome instability protein 1 n=1 Tax=Halichoeres trimaculatus TaxID=147232 RepID=UPI003D9DF555
MAPGIQVVAHATQSWLKSSWHIQVPTAWLEACVGWLQEEAGGADRLSQQQINQQVLDQWLLTDLRDLDHAVLPEGISQAQKTELSGNFCVQVDSLLDISQPAYGQLQSWRGTDCANDEVSAVTQTTQRPWEAKATRMLLLQVTDGVQSLEAMEYQPIPALSAALRPGVKLQLHGRIVCRLGMLLLGPSNIKVLGGEVEDLVERNNQGRVLCRTLGLPEEEEQQQQQQQEGEGAQQGCFANPEVEDLEVDDAELLANLEAQEVAQRVPAVSVPDSGYETFRETSFQSSMRSAASTVSSRSIVSNSRGGPHQDHYHSTRQDDTELFDLPPPEGSFQQETPVNNMADDDFPEEDFEDFPLDELDGVIVQQSTDVSSSSHRSTGNPTKGIKQASSHGSRSWLSSSDSRLTMQERNNQSCSRGATEHSSSLAKPSQNLESVTNDEDDFMDEDCDFLQEIETSNQLLAQQGAGEAKTKTLSYNCGPSSSSLKTETHQGQSITSSTEKADRFLVKEKAQSESSGPALSLTSPPFTYLCLLEEQMSKQNNQPIEICVKAFIVTLLGKLSSSSGLWRVCATISDGTSYLDVELSNEVLMGLLGFSVAEKAVLKRDPTRKGELDTGMRRCQEELVDMCCIMTIVVEPEGGKAVVTKADPVSEKVLQELEQRVGERK